MTVTSWATPDVVGLGNPATLEGRRPGRVDGDRGLRAGDRAGDGVGRRDRSAAGGLEDHADEGVGPAVATNERVVRGEDGLDVRAREVDGSGVTGDGVAEPVLGRDG